MNFPRGNYYLIICKAGDQALRIQELDQLKRDKSRVIGAQIDKNDNAQIWMIQKIGQGDHQYEIVNCLSTLVCETDSKQIRLRFGKQHKDQLYKVESAPIPAFYKYYWIKNQKGDEAMMYEGILRFGKFDANSENQLFRFEQVTNPSIEQSAVIINNMTGKVIDVPEATLKKGEKVVQWGKNKRWNQRWRIIKQSNGIVIESFFNDLVLDVEKAKKQNGAKIIQWIRSGDPNQLWIPEQVGNGVFKLRTAMDPNFCLDVKKADVDDGANLEISNKQNPTMYWRFQGAQPI